MVMMHFIKDVLKIKSFLFSILNLLDFLKEEQKKGIRINDPNNPGRIYFSGKGLDYPFHTGFMLREDS